MDYLINSGSDKVFKTTVGNDMCTYSPEITFSESEFIIIIIKF